MHCMARKKTIKKRKLEPAIQTMSFVVPNGISTVDLSQCASIVNRRFYRQGINWVVSGFRFFRAGTSPTAGTGVQVSRLPNSWMLANGWEKAFRAWDRQQREAIDESGAQSAMAKFRDFKIHMDVQHVTDGFGNNLLPRDHLANQAAAGEWEPSSIVVPNILPDASGSQTQPIEYLLHGVGINNNAGISRGIIEGYADSRAYPQSPDPVSPPIQSSENWLRDMFDVGNDTNVITENATDVNDDLPYPQINYPGGENQMPGLQVVDVAYFSTAQNSNKLYCQGDNFPCGLVRVFQNTEEDIVMLIDLVPGTHRGYLCEPMTEM